MEHIDKRIASLKVDLNHGVLRMSLFIEIYLD